MLNDSVEHHLTGRADQALTAMRQTVDPVSERYAIQVRGKASHQSQQAIARLADTSVVDEHDNSAGKVLQLVLDPDRFCDRLYGRGARAENAPVDRTVLPAVSVAMWLAENSGGRALRWALSLAIIPFMLPNLSLSL